MNTKFFFLMTAVTLLAVLCTTGLAAQNYSLTVQSKYGFKYYGESLSGIVYDSSYTISQDTPFTVTLAPTHVIWGNSSWDVYGCGGLSMTEGYYIYKYGIANWTANGTVSKGTNTVVTVDNQTPLTATAGWQTLLTGDGIFTSYSGVMCWFCPPQLTVKTGETFNMSYVVSVPGGYYFACDIGYDASKLQIVSLTNYVPELITTLDYTTAGSIKLAGTITSRFTLLSITWHALADGDVPLSVNITQFTDINGNTATIDGYEARVYPASMISIKNSTYAFGDVNGDTTITIVDALLVAQDSAGLLSNDLELAAADVNVDGTVDIVDALIIVRYNTGLVTKLPVTGSIPTISP